MIINAFTRKAMHKWNLQHNGVTAQNVNAVWQKTNANTSYLISSNPCHN